MKKTLIIGLLCSILCAPVFAQDEPGYLNDQERVALTAVVLDDNIPAGAHKQLVNKMTQIAAKSGCAATSNSRFIITCSADILTKDITPTAPPQHAYTVALNFYVGDGVEGRLFSSYSVECKGVGQTPDKAYINALKNVRVNDPGFKAMCDKGKKEIIAYYNTYCDLIISDARAMIQRHEFTNAIDLLNSVPEVCESCYKKANDESVLAYQAWQDDVCNMALIKAQSAWAVRDAQAAAEALEFIPAEGACIEEANALRTEIADKLDAKEREEWEFKMKQYEDAKAERQAEREARLAVQKQQAEIQAQAQQTEREMLRESLRIATSAVGASDSPALLAAPALTYLVKGKWF